MKAFNFFNSAYPQCEEFLANFLLLHVQNVVVWALMKGKSLLFFAAGSWDSKLFFYAKLSYTGVSEQ